MVIQIVLGLLLFQAGPQKADLSQLVTIEQRAAPLNRAIEALAQATRTPLSASQSLWTEVVAFKVRGVRLIDLMSRIADAACCEWFKTAHGYALRRSDRKVAEDDTLWLAIRARQIQKQLDKLRAALPGPRTKDQALAIRKENAELRKQLRQGTDDDNVWRRYELLNTKNPSEVLLKEAALLLGARQLASVQRNERVVFSTHPTRAQRPMPAGFDAVYARYRAAQELFGPEAIDVGTTSDSPDASDPVATVEQNQEPSSALVPAITHLAVERSDQYGCGPLSLQVRLFDGSGYLIEELHTVLKSVGVESDTPLSVALKPQAGEKALPLSLDAIEFAKLVSSRVGGPGDPLTKEIRDRWHDRILDMDRFEPLSYGSSELVFALAEDRGQNVVAIVPDLFAEFTSVCEFDKYSLRMLLLQMNAEPTLTLTEDSGWMIIRPAFPSESRLSRTNRKAASTFLGQIEKAGRAGIDDLARFVANTEALALENFGLMLQPVLISTRRSNDYGTVESEELLRLYGRLQPEQRATLLEGGTLLLASLPPELATPVRHILFGANASLGHEPSVSSEVDIPDYIQVDEYAGYPPIQFIDQEVTQSMPNGVPAEATLSLASRSKTLIQSYPSPDPGTQYQSPGSLEGVAYEICMRDLPDPYPWINEIEPRAFYKLSLATDLLFTFRVAPGLSVKRFLRDTTPVTIGKAVTFADLPLTLREDIARLITKKREERKDSIAVDSPGLHAKP